MALSVAWLTSRTGLSQKQHALPDTNLLANNMLLDLLQYVNLARQQLSDLRKVSFLLVGKRLRTLIQHAADLQVLHQGINLALHEQPQILWQVVGNNLLQSGIGNIQKALELLSAPSDVSRSWLRRFRRRWNTWPGVVGTDGFSQLVYLGLEQLVQRPIGRLAGKLLQRGQVEIVCTQPPQYLLQFADVQL